MKENDRKLALSEPKSSCLLDLESLINLFLGAQQAWPQALEGLRLIFMVGMSMAGE